MNAITQSILSAGRASTIQDLVPILKAYRVSQRINQRALDQAAGIADGLTGKIEVGTRGLGVDSCNAILAALGLELAVVERSDRPNLSIPKVRGVLRVSSCPIENQKLAQKVWGMRGGNSRAIKMSPARRKEISRKAAAAAAVVHRTKAAQRRAVAKRLQRAADEAVQMASQPQSNASAPASTAAQAMR